MTRADIGFKNRVCLLISQIPYGRLMTYGQVAALCGHPRSAWEVGQIAHRSFLEFSNLPWHRVVNKKGGLALGWPNGGRDGHKAALEAEEVKVDDYRVDINSLMWWPEDRDV